MNPIHDIIIKDEYDKTYSRYSKSTSCKHCELDFSNLKDHERANHSRWCNKNPKRPRPVNKKTIEKTLSCSVCGIDFVGYTRKTCSSKCAHFMSDDRKQALSQQRKKYLSENPDKHPWKRDNKKVSVPCENVKKYLRANKIDFVEELTPLSDRGFSIDIAFPHLKIGIEINGNQHYDRCGNLKPYYQERHDLIVNAGWTLIEVHYTECFGDERIAKFLNFDIPYDNSEQIRKYFDDRNSEQEQQFCGPVIPRNQRTKLKTDEKWEPIKNEIFNHGIDFSKFGWVTLVSNILGIPTQKVNKWMKRYHSDFYQKSCFHRKSL